MMKHVFGPAEGKVRWCCVVFYSSKDMDMISDWLTHLYRYGDKERATKSGCGDSPGMQVVTVAKAQAQGCLE